MGKKTKITLRYFSITAVVVLSVFICFMNFGVSAQTVDGSFTFSPSSETFRKGCRYDVDILVDPGSNTSNAANFVINYDPTEIEVIDSMTSIDGIQIAHGDAYEAYADNVVDETAGTIRLTGFSIMSTLTQERVFGTIEFRSTPTATSADFSIEFTGPGNTLDSNIAETATSDDILASVGTASYTFVDGPCVDDTNGPSITPIYPENYNVEVPLDSDVEVRICDNGTWDSGVDIDTVEVIVDGISYTPEDSAFFSYTGDPDCYVITIDPQDDFPADSAVTVVYRASDFAGNSSTRSIVFNIPADVDEIIEQIYEIITQLEECEDQVCDPVLPTTGVAEVVQKNEVVAEALVALPVATGIISMIPTLGFSFLEIPYYIMQLIMWLLNLLGVRKKGAPWGVIYDSVSKSPVARAVVRLFSGGKLIESRVSDVNGVFNFTPRKGVYTMIASKRGYVFPSTVVSGNIDGAKVNIYRGGPYTVISDKDIVRVSVPLDPVKANKMKIFFRKTVSSILAFMMALNPVLLVLGIVLSGVLYYYTGDRLNLLWIAINIVLLALHFYLSSRARARWGVVASRDGVVQSGVEVGLYETAYNKLVDTRITDEKGRFQFVVPGNLYVLRLVSQDYVIDDPKYEGGYPVGKKVDGDILITEKIKVRRVV